MDHGALYVPSRRNKLMVGSLIRKYLHIVGSGLGLIGVAFVATRLMEYRDQLPLSTLSVLAWFWVACLATGYGLCGAILALAWRQILIFHGVRVTGLWSLRTYGTSQLAKYIPGNIFHLASRQAIGVAAGMPAWPFAKSIGWELAVISATALLFTPLAVPLQFPGLGPLAAATMFVSILILALWLLRIFLSSHIASATAWYATFLLLTGLIFSALLALTSGRHANMLLDPAMLVCVCGAYVLAWLAGLVTPGAPAGVGVREAVLYWLLHGVTGHADLIAAIILGRAVTVGGDLFFFVGATFARSSHS